MIAALLAVGVVGCAVGPDYVAPPISAPEAWHAELRGGATAQAADPQALARWWTTLDDPMLTSLIERAVQGNLDVKKAKARVREARARRGINQADLFPTLNATGSGTYGRGSANVSTDRGSVEISARESYSVGLDASWELDVFGGVRRSVEAATAIQASRGPAQCSCPFWGSRAELHRSADVSKRPRAEPISRRRPKPTS
jgi:outer membrane protein TolC